MAVAEEENFSAAARGLGISQPTISRYLQSLEAWLGKKLVEPGRISDPENPGVSVGLTDAGRAFFEVAEGCLNKLDSFRTVEARGREQLSSMQFMVRKMHADLTSASPSKVALRERGMIELLHETVAALDEGAPLEALVALKSRLWSTFAAYEAEKTREIRKSRIQTRGNINPTTLRINPEPSP